MPEEERLARNAPGRNVTLTQRRPYVFPEVKRRSALAPVVVGMGPAGLFCAYLLAQAGFSPILIDRGDCVADRVAAVVTLTEEKK